MRRLIAATAIALVVAAAAGARGEAIGLHVVSSDATTVTLGWTVPTGTLSQHFKINGVYVSWTRSTTQNTVRFTKNTPCFGQAGCYVVEQQTLLDSGSSSGVEQPPPPQAIQPDEFNSGTLSAFWQELDPLNDGTVSLTGSQASLAVPAGRNHDLDTGAFNSLRLVQVVQNQDFTIETKFDSRPSVQTQQQGLVAQQDADDLVRFDVYYSGGARVFLATYVNGARTVRANALVPTCPSSYYMRLTRASTSWSADISCDDATFTNVALFTHTMTVTQVGFGVGNYGSPAPAFTGLVDWFHTTSSPPPPPQKAACENGLDDDGDGKIDYPADPGCIGLSDDSEVDETPPPPGAVTVSQSGNDSTCSRGGTSCATWLKAYQIAQSGDTINVGGGTYPGIEQMTGTKQVTFQVVPGQSVTMNGPFRVIDIENLTVKGPLKINVNYELEYSLRLQGCNRNVEFFDVSGTHFNIGGSALHVWFHGGVWGNYTKRPFSSDSTVSGYYGKTYLDSRAGCSGKSWNADGILRDIGFDGVKWENCNYNEDQGGGHPDCLESSGGTDGVVIRNSEFRNCGDTCIGWFTDWWHNYNMVVENTLFRYAWDTAYGIQMGIKVMTPPFASQGQQGHASCVFRYNTYFMDDPAHDSVNDDKAPPLITCDTAPSGVYGNIIEKGHPSCGNEWQYNVFEVQPCGLNSKVGTVAFVDRVNYNLAAGSIALGAGDPSRFPVTDYQGTVRTSPPDAGRDQR